MTNLGFVVSTLVGQAQPWEEQKGLPGPFVSDVVVDALEDRCQGHHQRG